jgi:hypothetical protein
MFSGSANLRSSYQEMLGTPIISQMPASSLPDFSIHTLSNLMVEHSDYRIEPGRLHRSRFAPTVRHPLR